MITRVSLRFLLALSFGMFVLLIFSGALSYWYSEQEQGAERALLLQLQEKARIIASTSEIGQRPRPELSMPASVAAVNNNLQVALLTTDGNIHNISDRPLSADEVAIVREMSQHVLQGYEVSREIYNSTGTSELLYAAAPINNSEGKTMAVVCIFLRLKDYEDSITKSRRLLLGFGAFTAFLSVLLGGGVASWITRRIDRIQRLTARIAGGDYATRLSPEGPAELSALTENLNQMAAELEKQQDTRRFLLASFAHELARPVGGLRLGVDSLLSGALDDREMAEDLLTEMRNSLQNMEEMFDDLVLVANPKKEHLTLHPGAIAVEPFLRGISSRFWSRAESRGVHIVIPPVGNDVPPIWADSARLNQILGNLVDNALKFSPTGGIVTLSAEPAGAYVRLSVIDSGPGIPVSDLPKVWEPFFQSWNGSQIDQGMGLGLSIVRELVTIQGGYVQLENLPGGGLQVSIFLPSASQRQHGNAAGSAIPQPPDE